MVWNALKNLILCDLLFFSISQTSVIVCDYLMKLVLGGLVYFSISQTSVIVFQFHLIVFYFCWVKTCHLHRSLRSFVVLLGPLLSCCKVKNLLLNLNESWYIEYWSHSEESFTSYSLLFISLHPPHQLDIRMVPITPCCEFHPGFTTHSSVNSPQADFPGPPN